MLFIRKRHKRLKQKFIVRHSHIRTATKKPDFIHGVCMYFIEIIYNVKIDNVLQYHLLKLNIFLLDHQVHIAGSMS